MGSVYRPKYRTRKTREVRESKTFWIKYYRRGEAQRENTHSADFTVAKRLLQSREGDLAKGLPVSANIGRIMIDELLDAVLTNYQINRKKSQSHVERRLHKHILPFFGDRRAVSITTVDMERYILIRQQSGASNASVNRELAILKRAFSLGAIAGKILHKPYIPCLKERNIRTGFFESEQREAVLSHLDMPLRRLMSFYNITGCRKTEGLTLQWPQVDFQTGAVIFNPGTTKNDEGRVFPFTEELRELLTAQRAATDKLQREKGVICPWVFHRSGKRIKSYDGAWRSACRKAGLPGRHVHDFRRTTVRRIEQAGISRSVGMKLTGHKTESVYRRYAIVSQSDLEEATRRLDAVAESASVYGKGGAL
jgi:integrase